MLDRIIWWMEVAGTAMDALLLLRVLTLRLHRVYTFVTLYCTLNILLDASLWLTGAESAAWTRIFIYSRFLWAFVFPLAAWDIFAEHSGPVAAIRRLQTGRLISGLVIASVLAIAFSLGLDEVDNGVVNTITLFFAFFLWFSAALASFTFLTAVYRICRRENLAISPNTFAWTVFFGITFVTEMAACFLLNLEQWIGRPASDISNIVLTSVDICVAMWCVIRLRGIRRNEPAPEKASA